jgi:hypothetical protein
VDAPQGNRVIWIVLGLGAVALAVFVWRGCLDMVHQVS